MSDRRQKEPSFGQAGKAMEGYSFVRDITISDEYVKQAREILDENPEGVQEFWVEKYEKEAKRNWDLFYKRNRTNFFKDRNYLKHEFEEIGIIDDKDMEGRETLFVEVGCGVGNTILPLLKRHAHLTAIGFDFSPRAVQMLQERFDMEKEGLRKREFLRALDPFVQRAQMRNQSEETAPKRCPAKRRSISLDSARAHCTSTEARGAKSALCSCPYNVLSRILRTKMKWTKPLEVPQHLGSLRQAAVFDITHGEVPEWICEPGAADFVMLMFVLSAINPEFFSEVARRSVKLLKPGGLLLFRDYGRFDLAQLRQAKSGKAKLGDNFYVRGDGTRAYYFTTEELLDLFVKENGLEEVENRYHCREFTNRKMQLQMKRIWVQAKFRKPSQPSGSHQMPSVEETQSANPISKEAPGHGGDEAAEETSALIETSNPTAEGNRVNYTSEPPPGSRTMPAKAQGESSGTASLPQTGPSLSPPPLAGPLHPCFPLYRTWTL
uniref:Methyltransferase-like protein n=1 Tax=Chromera velia CCMP2878 TaxID=1169474 RepID=A0A0G4H2D0_9ALVE|mmetsp:Transcript_42507/g.83804  ORF Transcript_42507/g.83804 Transcript_42507/m.83804 type:complete len:493 (-) Transcript_42507:19-1497(-)|eukprot:Cvel_5584.t1-p1 / transcript=Cvel_5584.t1 / gene=Cvel_5584 / organism=Chromera_velia_CCMP2878 / gene_product=O-methyltransferase 3, putative / transcript_product=O-methyltransferase 3, putative / location=Cvel_scaffold262:87692-91608(-) / protein_length=492 / sequence_SO=supercontig / SO=protein_coding / is_pseudo=false